MVERLETELGWLSRLTVEANYALERTVMDKVQLGMGRAPASRARRALVTRGRPAAQRERYVPTTGRSD
jgi:hypothetical protein